MKALLQKSILAALVLLGVILLNGCTTPDPDNASSRPWNSQSNWEHGLPTGINDGR